MYVCMYIYIYAYIHTYIHAYMHTYIQALHDAAWDALATGQVFAKVSRLVPEEEAACLRGQVLIPHSPLHTYTRHSM